MKEINTRFLRDIKNMWPAVVAIACYTLAVNLIFHNFCPMVIVTGLPCPGCGMTRALFYLLMGKWQQSIWMHPLGIPVACLLFYFFWNHYIIGRNAKGILFLIGITVIALIAVYIWRMYSFFPNRIPYVYTEHNILSNIFPFYEQILHEWKII